MRSDNAHFRSLNAAIIKLQSEDYQSPERARQTYATGVEGSKLDTDEKRSKKVYGKDGKVLYASLANLRRSLNKKNKKVAESVESAEYRPAGEEDRYYAKQRAEAAAAKAKKTTMNEGIVDSMKRKAKLKAISNKRQDQYSSARNMGTYYELSGDPEGEKKNDADKARASLRYQRTQRRLAGGRGRDIRNESLEYTELLESVLLALCEELALDPNELLTEITKKTYVNALQQYSDPQSERPQPKHDEDAIIARATREQGKKFGKNMDRLASMGGGNYPRRDKQGAEKSDEPDQSTTYPSSPARITKGGKMNKTDTRVLKQRIKDRIKTLKKSNRKAK